ncbi:MAG TPA: exo-alpha-sialidase [Blastocatellia bacterium]|nr:exo-alpha-sialidase [Blastocatellia bacterium]HMY70652.1 exo-alpha-sialidase [Blastocatellia bacterium]HMZ16868.1 exo-alpha-sialidase [Blastocatellia bacterium]HNG32139.1 exo-alpha-sialidase [Blastocatellia bacterium]
MPRFIYPIRLAILLSLLCLSLAAQTPGTNQPGDPRNIKNGSVIPDEGYSDQPYVVITNDGAWLCVMTTGKGVEGEGGQHIIAVISRDKGRTWSAPIDIEPATGFEASWVVPFKTPSGRVYAFYTYNKANLRVVPNAQSPGVAKRVDTLGVYAFKYSDDNGRTWSADRYEIPMHVTEADRDNNFGGQTLFFWGVSKPIVHKGAVYWGWNRVTRWGMPGVLVRSQGHFMRGENLLTERDPRKLHWRILPESDDGVRAPKGPIAEEINLVSMSDGSLYATYRTIDGYLCHAYSRDDGRTWTPPAYATFANGRPIKHPRAYAPVWKLSNGKYLLWFHNHGGEQVHTDEWGKGSYYQSRNPVWVSGGVERNGRIEWSEPEILLYDDDTKVRMSYPDLIEDGGHYYITETQKSIARTHELDASLLEGMWRQAENKQLATRGPALTLAGAQTKTNASFSLPQLPSLQTGGFTIDGWLRMRELSPGQVIFDARDKSGRGLALTFSNRFTLKLTLHDGQRESTWDSDPGTSAGTLKTNVWQHFAVTVDGQARIITYVIDGVLNDGGAARQYGWGRIDPALGDVNGLPRATIAPALYGEVKTLRIYDRALTTAEAIGNFHNGRNK